MQFGDEDEEGEPGVGKLLLHPWGHCWQWELLLGKLGFSFYRFGSLLGEIHDFVMSFVAKL